MCTVPTVAQVLAGLQPASADEARRFASVHATRLRTLESKLEAHRSRSQYLPAREVRALVAEIGDVQTAVDLLDAWANALS